MIKTTKLQGHGAAVLCLDVSSPFSQPSTTVVSDTPPTSAPSSTSALLLSGSEDGTARLWDLRDHRRRACLCIRVPGGGDVLSAVFAPPPPITATLPTTMRNENESAFSKDCTVFLGVENTVLEYDLRHVESPIVCSEPTRDWGRVLQNQDEVNQIGLVYYSNSNNKTNSSSGNKKKKNQKKKGGGGNKKRISNDDNHFSLYLAACDDAGKTRWTEASRLSSGDDSQSNDALGNDHASSTIIHHDNHGVAVVPACAFRPIDYSSQKGGTSLELVTGGTDCKIQLWDILRPKKPISTFVTNQSTSDDKQSKPQVCNPPFVYSLAWSNDGKSLSAGLGDGTVGVFEINNRTLVQRHLLVGSEDIDGTMNYAHQSSVASVVYPSFSASTTERILCSAGSDGAIVFWDLGKQSDEEWDDFESTDGEEQGNSDNDNDSNTHSVDDVSQLFPPRLLQELGNRDANERKISAGSVSRHKPRVLFDISHGEKINWVTPAASSSSEYNNTIFVADTSPDITSYTISF